MLIGMSSEICRYFLTNMLVGYVHGICLEDFRQYFLTIFPTSTFVKNFRQNFDEFLFPTSDSRRHNIHLKLLCFLVVNMLKKGLNVKTRFRKINKERFLGKIYIFLLQKKETFVYIIS